MELKQERGVNNFRFVVLGDSRGTTNQINEVVFRKLLNNIKKYHYPNFILFGGDMILGRSTSPKDVTPTTEFIFDNLTLWKNIVRAVFPEIPVHRFLYPSIGNHDVSKSQSIEESERAFNQVFDYLPEMLPGYGRTVYYFDYGNARFIVLNARMKNKETDTILYGILESQQKWLENVLKKSKKTHNFVMFHWPAFATDEINSLDKDQRKALWQIIDKYNVTAVYVGHEHQYNRRIVNNAFFFDETSQVLNNEILQITLGGAGAPLEPAGNNRINIASGPLSVFNYMVVDIAENLVISKVYDINENCIDSFTHDSAKSTPL